VLSRLFILSTVSNSLVVRSSALLVVCWCVLVLSRSNSVIMLQS
jgi:hypothetical protein